jgi:predicted ribosomally synthesized peptide with nif11-like leader
MSTAEIDRFNSDLKRDAHLREQLKQRTLPDIVAFAAERGYSFSVDEADAYRKAKGSMELDDAQLDAVAGGRESTIAHVTEMTGTKPPPPPPPPPP